MQQDDRDAIADLFNRLRQVEERSGPRDPEAEGLIRSLVAGQPAAPYFMAQTIVVQNQALADAQRRIAELEAAPRDQGGGLFGGLFGGGSDGPASNPDHRSVRSAGPVRSDGFLSGATQTAFGVAGGVLLANMVANSLFGGDGPETVTGDQAGEPEVDPGGDFDGGDFDIGF